MLLREKAAQAQQLLIETGLDCWMTFVRETGEHPDPGVELVVGCDLTWLSAVLFHRSGQRIAVVGRFDVSNVRAGGVFDEILAYDQAIRPVLVPVLARLDPRQIGLNFSTDDHTADGLTHGMWQVLRELLRDTPYADRLTSAAPLLSKLRGRKSPAEVERIRAAIRTAETVAANTGARIRVGTSELELADFVHEQFRARGVESAWSWDSCPIVNCGPESEPGHGRPRSDLRVQQGQLVHIDLGVKEGDYCSDLQRMWYVRRPGETDAPENVRRAFHTVVRAIEAGARALVPGARGFEVDAAARRVVVEAGYDEFKHGFGHGLGRACHDGGTLLGPRWEKYGKTPEGIIEPGNVFTLELGVTVEAGYIGLEEDVLVTSDGCEFLSSFQRNLLLL
jgi:Xaa-Pro aminopeptidase